MLITINISYVSYNAIIRTINKKILCARTFTYADIKPA